MCFVRLSFCEITIMASPGQRKGACGHIMASFDKHSRCARCRDKGLGDDPCIRSLPCEHCELLTPQQVIQLATPTYKLRKEKQKSKDSLVDPASVTVLSQVEPQDMDPAVSSHNSPTDLSLNGTFGSSPDYWPASNCSAFFFPGESTTSS